MQLAKTALGPPLTSRVLPSADYDKERVPSALITDEEEVYYYNYHFENFAIYKRVLKHRHDIYNSGLVNSELFVGLVKIFVTFC